MSLVVPPTIGQRRLFRLGFGLRRRGWGRYRRLASRTPGSPRSVAGFRSRSVAGWRATSRTLRLPRRAHGVGAERLVPRSAGPPSARRRSCATPRSSRNRPVCVRRPARLELSRCRRGAVPIAGGRSRWRAHRFLLQVVVTEMVRTGPPGWAINFEDRAGRGWRRSLGGRWTLSTCGRPRIRGWLGVRLLGGEQPSIRTSTCSATTICTAMARPTTLWPTCGVASSSTSSGYWTRGVGRPTRRPPSRSKRRAGFAPANGGASVSGPAGWRRPRTRTFFGHGLVVLEDGRADRAVAGRSAACVCRPKGGDDRTVTYDATARRWSVTGFWFGGQTTPTTKPT